MSFESSDAVLAFEASPPTQELQQQGPPHGSPPPRQLREAANVASSAAAPLARASSLVIPAFQSPVRGGVRRNSPGTVVVEDVPSPYQPALAPHAHPEGILTQTTGNLPAAALPPSLPTFQRRTSLTVPTLFVNTTTPSDTSLGRHSSLCMDDLEETEGSPAQHKSRRLSLEGKAKPAVASAVSPQHASARGQRMRQSLWVHSQSAGGSSFGMEEPEGPSTTATYRTGNHIVLPAIFLSDATPQTLALGTTAAPRKGWGTPRVGDELHHSPLASTKPRHSPSSSMHGDGPDEPSPRRTSLPPQPTNVSPTEYGAGERWSPQSGEGSGGHPTTSRHASPPAHSRDDPTVSTSPRREHSAPEEIIVCEAKQVHQPWYGYLLLVSLLMLCGVVCARMAVSEKYLFSFAHLDADPLSAPLAHREHFGSAPETFDPLLATSAALDQLLSQKALLRMLRTTVLVGQQRALGLFGRSLNQTATSTEAYVRSVVSQCVEDVGPPSSGQLLVVNCSYKADVRLPPVVSQAALFSPEYTLLTSNGELLSLNVSSGCPSEGQLAPTRPYSAGSVYPTYGMSIDVGQNTSVMCGAATERPDTYFPVHPIDGLQRYHTSSSSSIILYSSSQPRTSATLDVGATTAVGVGLANYYTARCIVYPSTLLWGGAAAIPPMGGFTFFDRQGAVFVVELAVWVAVFVFLVGLTRLFFSVQKVMQFVVESMHSVTVVCRHSLAGMKEIDPDDLLKIKLAFCFRGVDVGAVNEYLVAVEMKHRDFRPFLPRGLVHVVGLTSNGSAAGGLGLGCGGGSCKGSLRAVSPRRDVDGLQPLISPRAQGATSPSNSFRAFGNTAFGSNMFSPRHESVRNPFSAPSTVPNEHNPLIQFDVVTSVDSPDYHPEGSPDGANAHHRGGAGEVVGNNSFGRAGVSPPNGDTDAPMDEFQQFRRRTQTDTRGTTGSAHHLETESNFDGVMEDEEMPNLNEYEGVLVSFGIPGMAVAAVDRLQMSSRSVSALGGGPPSVRRTSEVWNNNANFLSPQSQAGRQRRVSGQSILGLRGGGSSIDGALEAPQLPPTIHVLGPESEPATTNDESLRPTSMHDLDQSLPTVRQHSALEVDGTSTPQRSGSVFDVTPMPATIDLNTFPHSHRRSSGNTASLPRGSGSASPPHAPPQHRSSLSHVSGGSVLGIAPGSATSPSSKRRSTNQQTSAALAEVSSAPANHMAHAGIRKVTFVVCQLTFGCNTDDMIHMPEASFGMRVSGGGHELSKERLAAMEKCSDLFLQYAVATCADFQGVTFRMTMSSVVMTFNAFDPCPFHEARGCFAALHLAQELQEHLEDMLDVQAAAGGVRWGVCVNSGAAVVGVTGTPQKMSPAIVSDALTIAQTTVKLASIIRCHVLVLEPCYHVSRTQVFCVPVDIVGHEGAQLIVFELKGRLDDFRQLIPDYQPFMDGFACLAVHKFDEAEDNLQQALAVDHNASRLLSMVKWCKRVLGTGAASLPKPYHRHLPLWDSPELLAEQEELDEDVVAKMQFLLSPEQHEFLDRPRLLSTLAESIFRGSDRNPSVDMAPSPFPWSSNRNSFDYSPTSRKSSNTTSAAGDEQRSTRKSPVLPVEIVDRKNAVWWRSDRLLGQGAFGAVYQGLTENGALVAMKVLPLNAAEIRMYRTASTVTMGPGQRPPLPPHLEEVLKEISLLSQLIHPNIVQYHTSTIASNYLFIMMEFMSGGTLTRMVQMFGALPETVVRRFSKDILEGLRFLHSKQIVHRDINPNNVLLTLDGTCKLSDFGAAASSLQRRGADAVRRRFSEDTNRSSISSATTTTANGSPFVAPLLPPLSPIPNTAPSTAFIGDGQILGTPLFMAPEAARGVATTASDIWGFGVILCYCFSGTYPYPEQDYSTDVVSFLRRLAHDETYMPRIPRESIRNPAALRVIEQCLQRREELRPSAADLLMSPFLIL